MNMHARRKPSNPQLSRRQIMIGAAGLTFAFVLARPSARRRSRCSRRLRQGDQPLGVDRVRRHHLRSCRRRPRWGRAPSPRCRVVLAEELDADWAKVRIVPAPPVEAIYGNPGYGGMMYTAGSNAVTSYYKPLRTFGAQVRRVLLDNAAKKLECAGQRTDHRAERRGARQVRAAGWLWRDRGIRRGAGQGAGDHAGRSSRSRANSA